MKVAVAASLLRPVAPTSSGGTEVFAHTLTEGLVKQGHDVTLFATSDSQTSAKLSSVCSSQQTTAVFEGPVAGNVIFETLQARNIIQQSKQFDVIHNNYWFFFTITNLSVFSNCPIITTIHNNFWYYPNHKEILEKTHRKGKDMVVFLSKAAQQLAGDTIDSVVINNGIDVTAFPFSAESEEYVLWFSRLVPDKGIKDAMDAAHLGGFPMVVAGSPPIQPKNKLYIDEQVMPYFTDIIKYVGTPDQSTRTSLYQSAKALLFPTQLEEQFGLVLVEAMSCGTPVIAYNRGAIPEVVADGVTGFIIDPDDTLRPGKGSWTIKRQGVSGLIEAVKRIGEIDRAACRTHVEKNFTRAQMIEKYRALYEQVLTR